ncbi:MAG: PaaI family thioesterase [Novosphingobium sp.]|nr:PaaI family thioesterase [Novosphingobium sp.]
MKLPQYFETLGLTIEAGEDGGGRVLVMPFRDEVGGRPGFLHGGAIGGLLEVAAIAALMETLELDDADERRIKPINVTVDFMRGGRQRTTRATGTVTRLGTRVANVEAVAWQDDPAVPIASARLNYLIARKMPIEGSVDEAGKRQ